MNKAWKDYEVIATGDGEKLERWGEVILLRPDPQAIWQAPFDLIGYPNLSAIYRRSEKGGGGWKFLREIPDEWNIKYKDLTFLIKPMGFKHTGLFPEQAHNWDIMCDIIKKSGRALKVLNLFGYTGGATVALAKSGAFVTHVDAAKNMVERCKRNARLSDAGENSIRYIVDDCYKFVSKEIKRGKTYDAVLMDPPSYGRGPDGEVWKLQDSVASLTTEVAKLLPDPEFILINSYTTGLQPTVISNILKASLSLPAGKISAYELTIPTSDRGIELPCGCSGIYIKDERYDI